MTYSEEDQQKDTNSQLPSQPPESPATNVSETKTVPKDEDEFETDLPEDVYSLFALTDTNSAACLYSFTVIVMQLAIVILLLLDILDVGNKDNPLQVPSGVTGPVTIAQFFATVLTVASQSNFQAALRKITEPSGELADLLRLNDMPAPSSIWLVKMVMSVLLQCFAGMGMLVVSFVVNMQATSVLGLMLNFAALEFISCIQDLAFGLANSGYISASVEDETNRVTRFKCPVRHSKSNYLNPKRVVYTLMTLTLLSFYGVIVYEQKTGKFLCQKVYVQFGDDFRPEMSSYSGEYEQVDLKIGGRVVYVDSTNKESAARFAYCEEFGAWTFAGGKFTLAVAEGSSSIISQVEESDDPCSGYWARSATTETYDLVEAMSQPWMVFDYYTNQTLPIDHMTLFCLDCNQGGGEPRTCSNHGTCTNNQCECDFGRFGYNCEFAMPCSKLELDTRTAPFPSILHKNGKAITTPSTSYMLLVDDDGIPVVLYNKPVFVSETAEKDIFDAIILFLGRRWGLALTMDKTGSVTKPVSRTELVEYLKRPGFQAVFSGYDYSFLSDPMDIMTTYDYPFPVDIPWYKARRWLTLGATDDDKSNGNLDGEVDLYRHDYTQAAETSLLCAFCQSALNPCLNRGYCQGQDNSPFENDGLGDGGQGQCVCLEGYGGYLCEQELACTDPGVNCLNNGTCDDNS